MNEPARQERKDRRRDSRVPKRRWLRYVAEAIVVALVLTAIHVYTHRNVVSGAAPRFAAVTINGRELSLAQFRGHPVLVHFWATWCPVCKLEYASVAALAADYPVVGVAVWSGGAREVADKVRGSVGFPTVADPAGNLARRYGVTAVPTSFVLDGRGVIRFVTMGYTTELGLRVRMLLARYW